MEVLVKSLEFMGGNKCVVPKFEMAKESHTAACSLIGRPACLQFLSWSTPATLQTVILGEFSSVLKRADFYWNLDIGSPDALLNKAFCAFLCFKRYYVKYRKQSKCYNQRDIQPKKRHYIFFIQDAGTLECVQEDDNTRTKLPEILSLAKITFESHK